MWISKFQKIVSFCLIFFLFFGITVRIPVEIFLSNVAYATTDEYYDLVSIMVDVETYDETKTKIIRYSRDIQATLENTRVVIIPTPISATSIDIASLNESLYFEGYKSHKDVNYESRLVGTVLVGKIPLPIVYTANDSTRSLLPYIDFEDKGFIYNHNSQKYEANTNTQNDIQADIWHGVIAPNTGNFDTDIQALEGYFDKNHDFYSGNGVFDQSTGIVDGKDTAALNDYEPHVFYYDQFRENESLQYQKYIGYQAYLENIEDLTYNRYSKELAAQIKDQVLGTQNVEISELIKNVDPNFDISGLANGPDEASAPDVITRYITDNATKKYLEIFNSSTLGDMRKHIYNAGRYNDGGSKVHVDMPPFLISILDELSAEVIKNVNTSLEDEITDIVKNGLARDIIIPVSRSTSNSQTCSTEFHTYYFGQLAADMTNASQCSIYRGSAEGGTLVESNRGYNINNAEADTNLCALGMEYDETTNQITEGLGGFWGGNSPVNLSQNGGNYSNFQLANNNLAGGIRPVFDILGMKEINDSSKIPSPLDCFTENVTIQTRTSEFYSYETGGSDNSETQFGCRTKFQLPLREGDSVEYYENFTFGANSRGIEESPVGTTSTSRFCASENNFLTQGVDFETELSKEWNNNRSVCHIRSMYLNGEIFRTHQVAQSCTGGSEDQTCTCPTDEGYSYFKTISSEVLHTSPTDSEFGAQVQAQFTPSLPIDTDRYIDFIGAIGGNEDENYGYQKVDFPQLFRVGAEGGDNLEQIEQNLKSYLDNISDQINSVISAANPSVLSGKDRELYEILKTGEYPQANIDLYTLLQEKPLEVFTLQNESKEISYLDTLVFAVYWNNLDSISAKYKFIFEEYLGNQFTGNDYNFHLPKSKKSYEIAYFAAPGDSQNMYIKLDPEAKGIHPFADILSDNIRLQSTLQAANIGTPNQNQNTSNKIFKCAPPDGVPIWEWIPAVTCWIQTLLPPTFGVGESSCSVNTLFLTAEEQEFLEACEGDINKNGINDCLESKLTNGVLGLEADAGKYFYNTSGVLKAQIYDDEGNKAFFDNTSGIEFTLEKIEVPANSDEIFTPENTQIIFDTSNPELNTDQKILEAQNYVNFANSKTRAQQGEAKSYFSVKNKDANLYFRSNITTQNSDNEDIISLQSELTQVQVRGERLFLESFSLNQDTEFESDTAIITGGDQNIFLTSNTDIATIAGDLVLKSQSPEILVMSLKNYSKDGNLLPVNYPLTLSVEKSGEIIFSEEAVNESEVRDFYELTTLQESGSYTLTVTDSLGLQARKNFDILPGEAEELGINLGTNFVETGGNISTHLINIFDLQNNLANGNLYTLDIEIDGNGLVFQKNNTKNISFEILEGFQAFRLKSTETSDINTLNFILRDAAGLIVNSQTVSIETRENIAIQLKNTGELPRVGGSEYEYTLRFTDDAGNILTNLNSRVYLSIPSIYGSVSEPYTEIINGEANVVFQTGELAGQDVDLQFQFEGGNSIFREAIDILPGDPIKLDLSLSRDKIEANTDETVIVEAVLKDRYNNIVFTDSSTEITLQIPEKSQNTLNANILNKQVESGKAQFELRATDTPGRSYFALDTLPSLAQNTISLEGQRGFALSELSVAEFVTEENTLSDVGLLFFEEYTDELFISRFASKQQLEQSEDFQNLSQELGEELLSFWDTTNSTEITGVGQNAGMIESFFFWDQESITGSSYNGLYSVLSGAAYGDIGAEDYLAGSLLFERDNASLAVSSLIENPHNYTDVLTIGNNGDITKNTSSDITQDIELDFDINGQGLITVDMHNASLGSYVGRGYYNLSEDTEINFELIDGVGFVSKTEDSGLQIFESTGRKIFEIDESGKITRSGGVEIEQANSGFALYYSGKNIANFEITSKLQTNITRDQRLLETKLQTLSNTLIFHLHSNQYDAREIYADPDNALVKIFYKDPFVSNNRLSDIYNISNITGFENSSKTAGIGWQDDNTALLNIASGMSIGAATQDFHTLSFINLGDPVVSLKPLETTFANSNDVKSFDATLGQALLTDERLKGYKTFDYNNDQKVDILSILDTGMMEIYESVDTDSGFVSHNGLVFASDMGSENLVVTGDFSGDGYADIFFVNNTGVPSLYTNSEKNFQRTNIASEFDLAGTIVQIESFDMDNDGRDDIVTLDDSGEIHIFYGNTPDAETLFTKFKVGDSYNLTLSEDVLTHGGALSFAGIQNELTRENISSSDNLQTVDTALVDNFLYIDLEYDDENTKFLRSQYANLLGVEVQKQYIDVNGESMRAGDSVHLDITLKNTTANTISDLVYVDTIGKYFQFQSGDYLDMSSDEKITRQKSLGFYNIVLDDIELAPNQETTFRFELNSLPLEYGDMQVGLYEDGELGDDPYGDIILKEDSKNCGDVVDIFRSTDSRLYQSGTTTPSCESEALDIGNTHPNLVDRDDDGVPDYLQNILDTEDTEAIQDYASEQRQKMNQDSDNDGIPDSADSMDNTSSATDFMGALAEIDQAAGEISAEIDTLIEGLSCGFGGGSCLATPLNWAPLAPGNDPTLFGFPIGDGLRVSEGIPVFSALTGLQLFTPKGPICVPATFPFSPLTYTPGALCGGPGAGGVLGTLSPTNQVRIFVTPTLTGAVGTAVCFGGPAFAAGNSNPIGVHPIVPGGNCIVIAEPLLGCEGGEGDPSVTGYPYTSDDFGVIHANCNGAIDIPATPASIESQFVQDYLEYKKTGVEPEGFYKSFVSAFEAVSNNTNGSYQGSGEPLVSFGGGEPGLLSATATFNSDALLKGNFQDVIQIQNTSISGFPGFIMDWVERQLDEVTSKLTNLPKIFIILPDFSGVFDASFSDYVSGTQEAFEKGFTEEIQILDRAQSDAASLQAQKANLDCAGDDAFVCSSIDFRLQGLGVLETGRQYSSGIKEVYDFLGNIPLINLKTETIPVTVPWVEGIELERFILQWEETFDQWTEEIEDFAQSIPTPESCGTFVGDDLVECELRVSLYAEAVVDLEKLLSSLEANIEILEEYKAFPEKLSKLFTKKEDWLYQILCNLEVIGEFVGGWIKENGQRFKAWVELYMLIKSILKSWQVFIDIFNGYEAECHECKNERQDLQNFFFELVGSIIPSAPIIEFPKWPDIILDLHNVRVGMDVVLPNIEVGIRPIVLPTLPTLELPRIDPSLTIDANIGIGFSVPEIPLLPQFEIPELPDLPGLPSVELPDLPPPPKIPKLFGSIEGMMNIIKLVTKVMCILKNSPFVPEWRAGDQIAFLTERNGYLPTDFLNIQAPAFSYSTVSAIKISSYVNFEFEMDFITEATRAILAPIDSMSGNIAQMFDLPVGGIELINPLPTNADINISPDGVDDTISLAPLNQNPEGLHFLAALTASKAQEFLVYLNEHSSTTLTNDEFIQHVGQELASEAITQNLRTAELQSIWNEVFMFQDTKSDAFIHDLLQNNSQKFQTLTNILETEMQLIREQQATFKNISAPETITQVSAQNALSRISEYQKDLEPFNLKTLQASTQLISGKSSETQAFETKMQTEGDKLMADIRGGLDDYKKGALLAAENTLSGNISGNTCQANGAYGYTYEGMYILEDNKNYKLFDYTDILQGDEVPSIIDIDNDGDNDVIYQIENTLYFKENTKNTPTTAHISGPPLLLNIDDNKMFNGDGYFEAINGFREVEQSDGYLNLAFQKPSYISDSLYSLSYNTIVDRYVDSRDDFIPDSTESRIVDALPDEKNLISETSDMQMFAHDATLIYAGAMRDIILRTPELKNISSDIASNTIVNLTAGKTLYAGEKSFTMSYIKNNSEAEILRVPAGRSIEFAVPIEITELRGDAYIETSNIIDIRDTDIIEYIGKPVLRGSSILYSGDKDLLDESSHIDIEYANGFVREIDFRDTKSFELYDLARIYGDEYTIRIPVENDFYYARLQLHTDTNNSTQTQQILFSPQSESDTSAPEIGWSQKVRVPVYQNYELDLTPYIFEDGGLRGISQVSVDLDLTNDLDGDGDSTNDTDTENISIQQTANQIILNFGPFDEIFTRDIKLAIRDDNNNLATKIIKLEVYTPKPQINAVQENTISGVLNEELSDKPVRLYRYRGGVITKLGSESGQDFTQTNDAGQYDFTVQDLSPGLKLTQGKTQVATIDEYTGHINLDTPLATLSVLPSNNPNNTSLYPLIELQYTGSIIYRQYIKFPSSGDVSLYNSNESDTQGIQIQMLDQESLSSYRIPLGAQYNAGSMSVYKNTDPLKTPVMTVSPSGEITIDESQYQLEYKNQNNTITLVLTDISTDQELVHIIYNINASYILR